MGSGVAEKEEADEETNSSQQGEGVKGVLCLVGQGSIGKAVQGYHDVDKVRAIVDELFLTRPRGNISRIHGSISVSEGLITKEALLDAGAEMNRNKAVGVDGIPGTVVKEIEGCKITC